MNIKTKTEMLAMTQEELKKHRDDAWNYYEKVKAVDEFQRLED